MPKPTADLGPPMTRSERLIRWAVFVLAIGGFALFANHPKMDDPLHRLGLAVCTLATMCNFVLVGARGRDELGALPSTEIWLLRLGAVGIVLGAVWDVATALVPALPAGQIYASGVGFALMVLSFALGLIRRSRMPSTSQRPGVTLLD